MRTARVASYPTGEDIVGAQLGQIKKAVDALADSDKRSSGSNVTIPEIDLTFAPIYTADPEEDATHVTLAFLIPVNTSFLRVQYVYTLERTTASDFKRKRHHTIIQDIDDSERAAGRIERTLKPLFAFGGVKVDIFRLVAFPDPIEGSEGASNPADDPVFTDAPLLQLTTPSPLPGNLPKPILKFSRGLFAKESLQGVTAINQLQTVELNVNDGTNSLNIDDLSTNLNVPGTASFYQIGRNAKTHLDISKKRLKKTFSRTATLVCKFRLTNREGATISADSLGLPLSGVIDVGPTGNSGNILWNGHFTQLEGAGTLGNWQAYKPIDGTFGILDTGAGKLRYQDTEHRAKYHINPVSDADANKRWLVQNIGDLIRGDSYAFTFNVVSDGNRTVDFDVFLATIIGGVVTVENYAVNGFSKAPINLTATLAANVSLDVEGSFRFTTDADISGNTFFVCRLNSRVDNSLGDPFVFVDEYMMVPGLAPVPFAQRVLREYNTVPRGPVASTSVYTTGEEFGVAASLVGTGIYEQPDGAPDSGTGRIYQF